jgi:hypothetical protein
METSRKRLCIGISLLAGAMGVVLGMVLALNGLTATIGQKMALLLCTLVIWGAGAAVLLKWDLLGKVEYTALGLLMLLLGLCLLIWIRFLLALVPMVLGIYILVDSLGSIKRSLDMKALGFSRWWISCLVAAALAVCGLVMVLNPFGTIEGLVMFVGLGFLVDGVTTLVNTILLERLQR